MKKALIASTLVLAGAMTGCSSLNTSAPSLPLTGAGVVDLLITELGVFEINRGKTPVKLIELAPGVTVDDVKAKTEAAFEVAV